MSDRLKVPAPHSQHEGLQRVVYNLGGVSSAEGREGRGGLL